MNIGFQRTQKEIREIAREIYKLTKLGKVTNREIWERLKITRDQFYRYRRKYLPDATKQTRIDSSLLDAKPTKKILKNLNPIEFINTYLPVKPTSMQSLILKAFYQGQYPEILSQQDKQDLLNLKRLGKTTWEEGAWYTELVLIIGMKGGKTVLAGTIAAIEEYELFKIGDICKHFNFTPGQRIYIKNVATNKDQAEKTIFAQVQAFIDRSPYFLTRSPKLVGNTYHFRDTNVYIESGHSNSSSLVGDACKLVGLDELDRFKTTSGRSSAEEVYSALDKSTDPFGRFGKQVEISSLVWDKGFMVDLYMKSKTISSMLGFWMPEWEMQPKRYSGKIFVGHGIKIPVEHRDSYLKNPEKFLRDKACMIGYTKGAYYREPDKVRTMFEQSENAGLKNPIDVYGRFADWFRAKEFKYFEHHDPSVSHDAYPICLGHMEGDTIVIDMIHRFVPPSEGGEIDLKKVEEFCNTLHERFPNIELISYDTWAASSLMQSFNKKGLKVGNLYIKKPQHDLLKEKIYIGKFRCPKSAILDKELSTLELSGDKVDHPPNSSKDVADAVAGVTWNCIKAYGTGVQPAAATKRSDDEEEPDKMGFKKMKGRRRPRIWESGLR